MTLIRFKIPTKIGVVKKSNNDVSIREVKEGEELDVTLFDDADGIEIGVDIDDDSYSFIPRDYVEIEGEDFPWNL